MKNRKVNVRKMKLIHCADMHLDSALATSLTRQEARRRNDELFETFIKMMDYAQREKVRAVLVAGDLFDSENGREAVKKKVLEAVAAHPQVDFLVLSGNHDGEQLFNTVPDSGFNMTVNGNSLPKNLKLFPGAGKAYRYGNVVITGLNSLKLPSNLHLKPEDTNIVMMHGQIDRFGSFAGRNIDYLALGHIHKYKKGSIDSRGVYCYSGCLEARGFDECGEKGFVLLDTAAAVSGRGVYCYSGCLEARGFECGEKGFVLLDTAAAVSGSAGSGTENIAAESPECGTARKIAARFVPFAKRKAWEITVDCTDIVTTPQLYETVKMQIAKRALEEQTEPADSQDMIRVVLTGAKQSQAAYDMDYIKKYLEQEYYLVRLKDETASVREESGFEAYLEKYIMDSDETEDMKQEILACVKAALSQN